MHFAATLATALYSASALDRGTVGWRLEDQDTSASSKNTQKLEVERYVFGHLAQSASEYAMTLSSAEARK